MHLNTIVIFIYFYLTILNTNCEINSSSSLPNSASAEEIQKQISIWQLELDKQQLPAGLIDLNGLTDRVVHYQPQHIHISYGGK